MKHTDRPVREPRPDQPLLPLMQYDIYAVAFSGGKDSVALVLHLIELGVDRTKIELHHHLIDGDRDQLMDWPITHAYCKEFAQALGLRICFSWREGGMRRSMLRENALVAPVRWESKYNPGIIQTAGGTRGTPSTRLMFPQVTADLSVRWCSSEGKIDVMKAMLNNDIRYKNKYTLVLTGERGQESAARACYAKSEPHKSDLRAPARASSQFRLIDHWRPLRDWPEEQVWAIMERHRIQSHPAYELGFGRCSCAFCIFFSKNQAATARYVLPDQARQVAEYEIVFGKTIKRKGSFNEWADAGEIYLGLKTEWIEVARAVVWPADRPIILDHWMLPPGAFGESDGPL
jgi:3'-phosphoadenosine 5'-phosphosulfate sulfotransferase (PAPS reductase)/FAD synthetase